MKNIAKSEINKKFGTRVQIERLKRKISQEKLAEMADLNRVSIGKIERGISSPTLETIEKIANAFEIDILELLNFSNISI